MLLAVNEVFSQGWEWVKGYECSRNDKYKAIPVDGRYFWIAASSIQSDTIFDSELIKISSNGNILVRKTFPGVYIADLSLCENNDLALCGLYRGSVILDSKTFSAIGKTDGLLFKTDSAATVLWSTGIGTPSDDKANSVTSDGSMIFVSGVLTNEGFNLDQLFVNKYDHAGNELISKKWLNGEGRMIGLHQGNLILEASYKCDQHFVLGEDTLHHISPWNQQFLASFDTLCEPQWAVEVIDGMDSFNDMSVSDSILLGGYYHWTNGHVGKAACYTNAGARIIDNLYSPETELGYSDISSVAINVDGRKLILMNIDSSTYYFTRPSYTIVAELRNNGDLTYLETFYGASVHSKEIVTLKDDIYVIGRSGGTINFGNHSFSDNSGGFFIAKYSTSGTLGIGTNNIKDELIIYPNPNNGCFEISSADLDVGTATVTDCQGRELYKVPAGQKKLNLSLKAGIYFLNIESQYKKITKRVVVIE